MNECLKKYRKQSIQVLDLRKEYQEIKIDIQSAFNRVMDRAWYVLGEEVKSFEEEFANYCGSKYAIGVASGLDALTLTLDAWGIKEGDEVIVSANTYIATALAVIKVGAKPVLVDIESNSFNIDIQELEKKITTKTKAIVPTHMHGIPCDIDRLNQLAQKYNLKILDDASHAHGSSYKQSIIGSLCDASAFSLYPVKNLGAYGDAGIITTNDDALAQRLRELRNYGSKSKNEHYIIGYNSRLDEMQAAFLRIKLAKLNEWNSRRTALAEIYFKELINIEEIKLTNIPNNVTSSFYSFPILIHNSKRDELKDYLETQGIGSSILYPKAIHQHEALISLGYKTGDFPNAEQKALDILCLPISPHHDKTEIYTICTRIREFFQG